MHCSANVVTHFQVRSVMCIEYGQNENKQYLMEKVILGKMSGIYGIYVANVDKNTMM